MCAHSQICMLLFGKLSHLEWDVLLCVSVCVCFGFFTIAHLHLCTFPYLCDAQHFWHRAYAFALTLLYSLFTLLLFGLPFLQSFSFAISFQAFFPHFNFDCSVRRPFHVCVCVWRVRRGNARCRICIVSNDILHCERFFLVSLAENAI